MAAFAYWVHGSPPGAPDQGESSMKTAKLAALFVTVTLSLGMATQAAFAQTQTQGKTRTQVVNELKRETRDP